MRVVTRSWLGRLREWSAGSRWPIAEEFYLGGKRLKSERGQVECVFGFRVEADDCALDVSFRDYF